MADSKAGDWIGGALIALLFLSPVFFDGRAMMSLWRSAGKSSPISPPRLIAAAVILGATIGVSVAWERTVYTIPVLATLLFLAAGWRKPEDVKRKLDDYAGDTRMNGSA